MTTTEELQRLWQAQIAPLAADLGRVEALLQRQQRRAADAALRRYTFGVALSIGVNIGLLALLLPLVWSRAADLRYLGVGCLVVAVALLAILRAVNLLRLRHAIRVDGPVVRAQAGLAALQLAEVNATRRAMAVSVLLWLPLPVLLFEALLGLPVLAHLPLPWLLANLALGVLAIVCGPFVCRWLAGRTAVGSWARTCFTACLPETLRAAATELDAIAAFAREGERTP
jgi:hypothetical protein